MQELLCVSKSLCSEAAAVEVGGVASCLPHRRRRCPPAQSAPTFVDERIVAANTPLALREEAVRRMEAFVLAVIHEVVTFGDPGASNRKRGAANSQAFSVVNPVGRSARFLQPQRLASDKPITGTPNHGESRLRVLRQQLLVLRHLYANIQLGATCTQRDVYYRLTRFFPDQCCVNRVIQRLVQQLGMPRQLLGVVPGSRGCVGGSLNFHGVNLRCYSSEGLSLPVRWEELSVTWRRRPECGSTVVSITEEIEGFELHDDTRYIIVVEKHAVFFRLMEEKIFDRVPCVLLTSHGFPTFAALTLLANIERLTADAQLPIVALVDYNPSGLSILQQYKHNIGRIQECRRTCVHSLRWLSLRGRHFLTAGDGCEVNSQHFPTVTLGSAPYTIHVPFQPFTRRDEVMISNIIGRWDATWNGCSDEEETQRAWFKETQMMQSLRVKVELEVLYERAADSLRIPHQNQHSSQPFYKGSFSTWVCRQLFRRDYI